MRVAQLLRRRRRRAEGDQHLAGPRGCRLERSRARLASAAAGRRKGRTRSATAWRHAARLVATPPAGSEASALLDFARDDRVRREAPARCARLASNRRRGTTTTCSRRSRPASRLGAPRSSRRARAGCSSRTATSSSATARRSWSAHICPYSHGNRENHAAGTPAQAAAQAPRARQARRPRPAKGLTVVPLAVYLKGNRIKVEIALVQGKSSHDKRETEKRRELDREAREAMKVGRGR